MVVPGLISGCTPSPSPDTLTLTMSLSEQEWRVFREKVFPPFERMHGITINAYQVESGQLATKLEALQSAGIAGVDLFAQDNMNLAVLINKGLVADLSARRTAIPETVLDSLIQSCTFNGQLFFLPFRPNVQIIYYNTDAFGRYGLTPPRTWEQLLETARVFKEKEGEGRVLLKGFGSNPTATQVYEFVLQAGGDPYAFDDEGCVKAFTFLQELMPYASAESRRAKWDTTNEILARQQAYLAQNWPFGIVVLLREYGLDFIGVYSGWKGPAGERHVIGGDVFGIPANAPHKDLALAFIAYVHSRRVQELLVAELGWPSLRSDAYARVPRWQQPHYAAVTEALKHGVFRKNVLWWPAYAKHLGGAFREIVMEGAPVEETLKKYKAKLEREKARYEK